MIERMDGSTCQAYYGDLDHPPQRPQSECPPVRKLGAVSQNAKKSQITKFVTQTRELLTMKAETAAINPRMSTPRSGARTTVIAKALKKTSQHYFQQLDYHKYMDGHPRHPDWLLL